LKERLANAKLAFFNLTILAMHVITLATTAQDPPIFNAKIVMMLLLLEIIYSLIQVAIAFLDSLIN
jgi:hypothetical protein